MAAPALGTGSALVWALVWAHRPDGTAVQTRAYGPRRLERRRWECVRRASASASARLALLGLAHQSHSGRASQRIGPARLSLRRGIANRSSSERQPQSRRGTRWTRRSKPKCSRARTGDARRCGSALMPCGTHEARRLGSANRRKASRTDQHRARQAQRGQWQHARCGLSLDHLSAGTPSAARLIIGRAQRRLGGRQAATPSARRRWAPSLCSQEGLQCGGEIGRRELTRVMGCRPHSGTVCSAWC